MKIAVIGGGWYGTHIALTLQKAGHNVTLLERNERIFGEVSGQFGIRLHAGPHYPRSKATREGCQQGLRTFSEAYPELINQHEYSIYGLGKRDADNQPSKVKADTFRRVCKETSSQEIDINEWGYQDLHMASNVDEPSIRLGKQLEKFFTERLREQQVTVTYKCEVTDVHPDDKTGFVTVHFKHGQPQKFSHVVNATGYQSVLPIGKSLPFRMKIVYQPCLALAYKDKQPDDRPISFIVMDGWFPCLMPYDDRENLEDEPRNTYIVTHGKWTIMGSHESSQQARAQLAEVDEAFIDAKVRPNCEREMNRFWPEFSGRFEYLGWKGAVLAKARTDREFRSAVVFQHQDPTVTYVFPGKVSNVCDAAEEVLSLLHSDRSQVVESALHRYVRGGALDTAEQEIREKVGNRNTCDLQTYTSFFEGKRIALQRIKTGSMTLAAVVALILLGFYFAASGRKRQDSGISLPISVILTTLVLIAGLMVLIKHACKIPLVKRAVNRFYLWTATGDTPHLSYVRGDVEAATNGGEGGSEEHDQSASSLTFNEY